MTQQIKMIGLDLDGTLLNSKKELGSYTKQILKQAIDKGIIVMVATGRPLTGVPRELLEFPGMRYVLTANGARVFDNEEQKTLFEHLLPKELAVRILRVFEKYDTLREVYYDGQGYADKERLDRIGHFLLDPHMASYIATTRKPVADIWSIIRERDQSMDKVQALFADLKERAQAWEELEDIEDITVVGSLGTNIEVNVKGVNKGAGLLRLGQMLGIKPGEIMACGDSDNDIDMLKMAGLGVAMKNARSDVKAAANYVTGTNDDEGAAKAIEHFALRGGAVC